MNFFFQTIDETDLYESLKFGKGQNLSVRNFLCIHFFFQKYRLSFLKEEDVGFGDGRLFLPLPSLRSYL